MIKAVYKKTKKGYVNCVLFTVRSLSIIGTTEMFFMRVNYMMRVYSGALSVLEIFESLCYS